MPASSLANQKIIALTIDDAPSQHTREIVAVLKENNASATFFVIGSQVAGRQDILSDIVTAGHELGNHAMHDEPSRSLKQDTLISEMNEVQSLIDDTYASARLSLPPRYFRPGSGFFSSAMRATVAKLGFKMVLGSVYPHDPQIGIPRVNAKHVLSMVRSGSIVICHDRRNWTAPMLRIVLPELKRRGYVVTSVSGLLEAAGTKDGNVVKEEKIPTGRLTKVHAT